MMEPPLPTTSPNAAGSPPNRVVRGLDLRRAPALLGPETEPYPSDWEGIQLNIGNDLVWSVLTFGSHPALLADKEAAAALWDDLFGETDFDDWKRVSAGASLPATRRGSIFLLTMGHVAEVEGEGVEGRVLATYGPGCFVGLRQAWSMLNNGGKEEPPLRTRALPLPGLRLGASRPLQDHYEDMRREGAAVSYVELSMPKFLERVRASPALQEWLRHAFLLESPHREALDAALDAHPVLRLLDEPARSLLYQNGVLAKADLNSAVATPDGVTSLPWQAADWVPTRGVLVLSGAAKVDERSGDSVRTSGVLGPGTLLNEAFLQYADGAEGAPPVAEGRTRDDLWLTPGSELVVWDLNILRRLLWERAASRLALHRALAAGPVREATGWGRVTVVLGGAADGSDPVAERLVAPVALGMAVALSRTWGASSARTVCVVDPDGASRLSEDLGVRVDLGEELPLISAGTRERHAATFDLLRQRTLEPGGAWRGVRSEVLVLAPDQWGATFELATALAALKDVEDVVVILRRDPQDPLALRTNLEHLLRQRVNVVWLSHQPLGEWSLSPQVPERLVRVNLVDEEWRGKAREAAREVARGKEGRWQGEGSPPRTRTWHEARLLDDVPPVGGVGWQGVRDGRLVAFGEKGTLAASSGKDTEGAAARTCWRLSRMIAGKTVGLALSGGGVWGFSHVALVKAFEEHGLPIDYVSGTSFGAVVGGLFAGGGMSALDAFVKANKTPRLPTKALRALGGMLGSSFFRAVVQSVPVSTDALGRMVDRLLTTRGGHPSLLEETEVPFLSVGSNLSTHEVSSPHWRTVSYAVRLASGLAPLLPGLRVNGQKVVDGAILSNVPAQQLRLRNADFVVAANVIGAPKALEIEGGRLKRFAWKVWDATGQRPVDAYTSLWLVLWKASADQGRLHADALLDVGITGVSLFQGYLAPQLVEATRAALEESDFLTDVYLRYLDPGSATEVIETKLVVQVAEGGPR